MRKELQHQDSQGAKGPRRLLSGPLSRGLQEQPEKPSSPCDPGLLQERAGDFRAFKNLETALRGCVMTVRDPH